MVLYSKVQCPKSIYDLKSDYINVNIKSKQYFQVWHGHGRLHAYLNLYSINSYHENSCFYTQLVKQEFSNVCVKVPALKPKGGIQFGIQY